MTTALVLGVLRWLVLVAEIAVALPIAYLAVITIAALISSSRRSRRMFAPPTNPPTFAFLIPAHDEAALIRTLLASLARQHYPPDRYAVCVVADNCSDATAAIARAAGAEVFERYHDTERGKGYALSWLLSELDRRGHRASTGRPYVAVRAGGIQDDGCEVVVLGRGHHIRLHDGARREDAGDFAPDEAAPRRADLLADGDLVPACDEAG